MDSQHINILLIDDEIEFISTLAERLELRGYASTTAADGESGISMVAKKSFDVAILDLMMPGLNGLDTLRQIKTIDSTLPVILLTGHGSTKDGMEGMRIGAFDFLMKPLDINELLEKIKLALKETAKRVIKMKNSNDKAGFMGGVTASVTHELQNVLAIIKETSGLMEDFLQMNQAGGLPDFDERLKKCLETIKRQAYRGVTLTSGLNGFAHTPDSTLSTINIFETLKKMLAITDRLFKQKGVVVSLLECDKHCSITTDSVLFQMIAFSCIECLIDIFQVKTTITLAILSSENQAAIRFLYADEDLEYEDYQQKIIQTAHWEKLSNLCEQLGMRIETSTDTPAIFVIFK